MFNPIVLTAMLNPNSPVPLYSQLADIIRAKIRSGEYPAGATIPSEHRLAKIFGIGRPTVRQAIEVLVRKNLLIRRRGSGTFVKEASQEVDLFSLAGTISAFEREGLTVTRRLRGQLVRRTVAKDGDNPFQGCEAYCLSRLNLVEKEPVLIEDIYLHPELFAGIDRFDLSHQSLSRLVDEHYYLKPVGGKQTFRIAYISGDKAKDLGVSNSQAVLAVQRFLHFEPLANAIYSDIFCRTDRFVFTQTLEGH
jgi:GntR family transcriptional regulator